MTASERRQGLLFAIIGPPGSGKNTLMNSVLAHTANLSQLATVTTRPARDYEQHGREHLFVDTAEFIRMVNAGELLEWQQIHRTQRLYGIPRRAVEDAIQGGHDLIADIEVLGATHIRSLYPDNSVLVFIMPPSLDELAKRMRERGDTEEEITERLKRVPTEMAFAPLCDYTIVNDKVDYAAARLLEIVQRERERCQRALPAERIASAAAVVPLYNGDVLLPAGPLARLPLASGEIPHEAALRYLRDSLGVETSSTLLARPGDSPFEGSFLPPSAVHVEAHNGAKSVTFTYLYLLPQRIAPPPGWSWVPHAAAGLAPDIQAAVHALAEPARAAGTP